METTGRLWAIGYEDTERAAQVRDEIIRLGWDKSYLLLEGIAVVVRHPDGTYSINRSPSPGVVLYLGLGLAGFLAGLVIGMPLEGAAFGASLAGGAAVLADSVKIDEDFIREVQGLMVPGTSTLFVLAEEGNTDELLPAIRGLGGTILKTNVDLEREDDPVHPGRRLGQRGRVATARVGSPGGRRSAGVRERLMKAVERSRRRCGRSPGRT